MLNKGWLFMLTTPITSASYLHDDKRGSQVPIPAAMARYVNDLQLSALHSLESFGWRLAFIRRPLFLQAIVVVASPDGRKVAVLEDDGSINMDSAVPVRQ
jgi:hypothetical protein